VLFVVFADIGPTDAKKCLQKPYPEKVEVHLRKRCVYKANIVLTPRLMEMNDKPRAPNPSPSGRDLFPLRRKLDKIKMYFS